MNPAAKKRALITGITGQDGSYLAEYLLGLPLLGDYLEEGLAAFNESCDEFNARL